MEMAEALSKSARVRFVAILWERDPTGKKKIIAEWGAPNINQVEHGAIVMLGKEK